MCSAHVEHGLLAVVQLEYTDAATIKKKKKPGCKLFQGDADSTAAASRSGAVAPGRSSGLRTVKTVNRAASRLERGDRANLLRNADLSFPYGRPRAP